MSTEECVARLTELQERRFEAEIAARPQSPAKPRALNSTCVFIRLENYDAPHSAYGLIDSDPEYYWEHFSIDDVLFDD